MAELKIEISKELKMESEDFNLDVSKIVTKSITDEVVRFVALKTIVSKSKLSMKDAIKLGKKLKEDRLM